jgi:hypothetical protein
VSVFALPLTRPMADLAATGDEAGTAILRVRLPDGLTELALHREGPTQYKLEVIVPGGSDIPGILRLRYGLSGGGEQALLIPVSGGSGLARLPGYAAGRPWAAEPPVPASEVSSWDPAITAVSVRAAASVRTMNAWRRVGSLVPAVRDVLDANEEWPG